MPMQKLYVDYDGTIANTIQAIVRMYDQEFSKHPNYHQVDWSEIESWDFDELDVASREHIDKYFETEKFFQLVEFMPYADFILDKLKDFYQVCIVSMGNGDNLLLKKQWCRERLPYAEFIGLDFSEHSDKAHIDMSDGIFVDDVSVNLDTSNAQKKICFGMKYPWNENWTGDRATNWFNLWKQIGLPMWKQRH